jgi:hypothetical protein
MRIWREKDKESISMASSILQFMGGGSMLGESAH